MPSGPAPEIVFRAKGVIGYGFAGIGRPSGMTSFVEALKRRSIFRVATVYAVASWVILQLADVTFPALDIPEADIRYVIIALVALFPIVIVFSWAFEVTPEGLKRSSSIQPLRQRQRQLKFHCP